MSDPKNKNYTVKPEIKMDIRLREVLIRMEVLTKEEVDNYKTSLEDSTQNSKTFSIADIV